MLRLGVLLVFALWTGCATYGTAGRDLQRALDLVAGNCDTAACTDPTLNAPGPASPDVPVPSSEQTDAETARVASLAWLAADDGDCDRAIAGLERVAMRDPEYFAHLALDPTFAACRP